MGCGGSKSQKVAPDDAPQEDKGKGKGKGAAQKSPEKSHAPVSVESEDYDASDASGPPPGGFQRGTSFVVPIDEGERSRGNTPGKKTQSHRASGEAKEGQEGSDKGRA